MSSAPERLGLAIETLGQLQSSLDGLSRAAGTCAFFFEGERERIQALSPASAELEIARLVFVVGSLNKLLPALPPRPLEEIVRLLTPPKSDDPTTD